MKHFINLKDIPSQDLRKIITDAKKRKSLRKKLSTLEVDKGAPLKGKLLIQMFEKSSLRTRLSFYLAIKQLGGGTLTLRSNELHLGQGGESIEDTAKILSTYGDGFMFRTDSDKKVENFEKCGISNTFLTLVLPNCIKSGLVPDFEKDWCSRRRRGRGGGRARRTRAQRLPQPGEKVRLHRVSKRGGVFQRARA